MMEIYSTKLASQTTGFMQTRRQEKATLHLHPKLTGTSGKQYFHEQRDRQAVQ
jgi:hypothetical protein